MTERSPAAVNLTIPHIQALIPTALELWTDNIIHTPEAKAQLTVTKTLNLSSGTLDLTAYVDGTSGKIRLDDLKKRTIYTTVGTALSLIHI